MEKDRNNNYCVIMCGGIGSHFWPFSSKNKPKQFLDFAGTGRSLLQYTFQRFNKIIPTENILVVTNSDYEELVRKQLPELGANQILLEPTRRNTAPCIAWASYHIHACNPNANIVVAPCDHVVMKEDEFLEIVEKSLDFAADTHYLLTIGIKPNRPETGYGYIQVDDEQVGEFQKVKTFTEKPQEELARLFVESGEFYWNSGLFIGNINHVLAAFDRFLPEVTAIFRPAALSGDIYCTEKEQDYINEHFPICPNISIDFGIMEKADNAYMLIGNFGWSDIGSWDTLYELSGKDEDGNVTTSAAMAYNSKKNMTILPKGKLAILQDLEGYLVVDSDKVLMICKRDDPRELRNIVNEVQLKYGDKYM